MSNFQVARHWLVAELYCRGEVQTLTKLLSSTLPSSFARLDEPNGQGYRPLRSPLPPSGG
jgi:hypothetical protein